MITSLDTGLGFDFGLNLDSGSSLNLQVILLLSLWIQYCRNLLYQIYSSRKKLWCETVNVKYNRIKLVEQT